MFTIKGFRLYILPVLIFFIAWGCDEEYEYLYVDTKLPVAHFEVQKEFLNVTVTNLSENASVYLWDFGNGLTSDEESPDMVVYDAPGTYTITLIAKDLNEAYSEYSVDVTVIAEPTTPFAMFSYEVDFDKVTFTNLSTRATSYVWDFGDGSEFSNETDPVHYYSGPGEFQVTLTASREGEEDHDTTVVVQTGTPQFVSPTFEGEKSDWGGNYSTSNSPTPPAGNGAKLDSEGKFIAQTLRVYPNTTYKIVFSAAIDGNDGTIPFTVCDAQSNAVLTEVDLVENSSPQNEYVEYSVIFDSGDASEIQVESIYSGLTIRFANFSIVSL
ncbi:PKD domain-containing protein [Thermophagus sp. OGC60D27]|uniref:PKD domain-containing protein n=1 Tax=Thermophagus sp. OGC60D27 TaxID=3458415 RepID=UPI004037EEE2